MSDEASRADGVRPNPPGPVAPRAAWGARRERARPDSAGFEGVGPDADDEGAGPAVPGARGIPAELLAGLTIEEVCRRNLLEESDEVIYFKDLDSRFLVVSAGCAALHGKTPAEMVGLSDFDVFEPAHAHTAYADEQRIIATGVPMIGQAERERWADKPDSWVASSKFPLRAADGTIIGTFGVSRSVTRLVVAEQEAARLVQVTEAANAELRRVEAQFRAVLDGTTDAIARYDAQLRYRYLNPAGERLRGLGLEALRGRTDREAGMKDPFVGAWEAALRGVLASGEPDDLDYAGTDAAGAEAFFHTRLAPDRDAAGAVVGVLTSTRDVTELKVAEQALARQAMHDSVTGLANRYLLTDRITQALVRMERYPSRIALYFIDLDHFKHVNDSYGHDVGDSVLVAVADRLRRLARKQDTVARLGGDEFVVLCDRVLTDEDAQDIAGRLVAALSEPVVVGSRRVALSASVGAVLTDDPTTSPGDLLRGADAAMYRSKQAGRNRFTVHDPAQTPTADDAVIEVELREALEEGRLRLLFQPLVSLSDQRLLGFEALLRWDHPRRGVLTPADFLDAAEAAGLMGDVGAWVLDAACAQVAAWDARRPPGSPRLTMAVNVSGRQLREPGLVDLVREVLGRYGLEPAQLSLEVAERALVQEAPGAHATLEALGTLGVRLAVDDFGATYTSLARLPHFPVSVVKLEQLAGVPWQRGVVAAVIAMAHGLGMSVVGEGIETPAQLDELLDLACDDGQGYLLSRPLTREQAEALLAAGGRPSDVPTQPSHAC